MRAGMEIDAANVAAAVARGLSVVQGDADTDLAEYPDGAFDYAILSQTLQTTHAARSCARQLLRIGARAFVWFPNFAHWRVRLSLLWGGRMPVTRLLPLAWYETPNIHHVTIDDFRELRARARHDGGGAWFLSGDRQSQRARGEFPRRACGVPAQALADDDLALHAEGRVHEMRAMHLVTAGRRCSQP